MATRLQVVVTPEELRDIQEAAEASGMSVSAWVCAAIRAARRQRSATAVADKLAVVAAASRHAFPTADIEEMLAEIEAGRSDPGSPGSSD